VGAVSQVSVVPVADVDPIPLPGDSWSRMLVTADRVPGTVSSIGCSVFTPGTVLTPVRHETEELAYVVSGAGELRLDSGAVGFRAGDALHIPAGVWHAVANTGDDDVVMVFGFPHPDYPPTERA
jgi:quercetin dioxygenase-like cupin family protein